MLKNVITFIFCIGIVMPAIAQIPLRHNFEKITGNVASLEIRSYKNLTLNEEDNPVFPTDHVEREVIRYENGQPISKDVFIKVNDIERPLSSTEYSRDEDGLLHHVIEYRNIFSAEKDSMILFRAFYPKYENGIIVSEDAINRFRELKEQYFYSYEPNEDGFPTIRIQQYDYRGEEKSLKEKSYELRHDLEGRVITKIEHTPSDTLYMYQRTAVFTGEELYVGFEMTPEGKKHIATHKLISRDGNGNPIFEITEENITTFNRFSRDGKMYLYTFNREGVAKIE